MVMTPPLWDNVPNFGVFFRGLLPLVAGVAKTIPYSITAISTEECLNRVDRLNQQLESEAKENVKVAAASTGQIDSTAGNQAEQLSAGQDRQSNKNRQPVRKWMRRDKSTRSQ